MHIEERIRLAPFTTFHIGGPARFFARVESIDELKESLDFARGRSQRVLILGGGSNVLADDAGFDGLVIRIEIGGVEEQGDVLVAGAGESWDALVSRAVEKNRWGVENLSGIPGTVGGAVVQNIGAYGAVLSQVVEWVEAFDCKTGEVARLSRDECGLGYRDSVFKKEGGRRIVLRAALRLSKTPAPNLSYRDLAARFAGGEVALRDIRAAVLEIRAGKFPDPGAEGSAGSFFKNPIVPAREALELQKRYPGLPLFPMPEASGFKVPLGWFLDYRNGVLDMRGVRMGGARLYEKQFLVLVAERGSSSAAVKELAALVQEKVRAVLGIRIEPEVKII